MTVTIRPATDADQPLLDAWSADPGPYGDWGDRTGAVPVEVLGRMLVCEDDVPVGDLSWHAEGYGGNAGSVACNIGIDLVAEARGRGIGPVAQRLLAEHLFATTTVYRVEASTDVTNIAEQRALEKAGFTREGILRGAQYRGRRDPPRPGELLDPADRSPRLIPGGTGRGHRPAAAPTSALMASRRAAAWVRSVVTSPRPRSIDGGARTTSR